MQRQQSGLLSGVPTSKRDSSAEMSIHCLTAGSSVVTRTPLQIPRRCKSVNELTLNQWVEPYNTRQINQRLTCLFAFLDFHSGST